MSVTICNQVSKIKGEGLIQQSITNIGAVITVSWPGGAGILYQHKSGDCFLTLYRVILKCVVNLWKVILDKRNGRQTKNEAFSDLCLYTIIFLFYVQFENQLQQYYTAILNHPG